MAQIKTFELRGLTGGLELEVSPDRLFMPNQTTKLFTEAVEIIPGDVVFDIGSGLGPLAIWSAKTGASEVYGIEIVTEQCELARENVLRNNLQDKIKIFQGSLFAPIPESKKADVIIADISGISEAPARALGWYPPSIPTGGVNGTDVILPLLNEAGRYLKTNGRLYFPVAGLSDYKTIMEKAREKFQTIIEKVNVNFPLLPQQLQKLAQYAGIHGKYEILSKGSRNIWKGWIYEACNPN